MEGEGDKFDNVQASFSSKIKLCVNLQTLWLNLALPVCVGVAVCSPLASEQYIQIPLRNLLKKHLRTRGKTKYLKSSLIPSMQGDYLASTVHFLVSLGHCHTISLNA